MTDHDATDRLVDAALATDHYRHPAIDALAMHARSLRDEVAALRVERDGAEERVIGAVATTLQTWYVEAPYDISDADADAGGHENEFLRAVRETIKAARNRKDEPR